MKRETVAVHGGYDTDPTTRAVAVPIYQTVAYEFDSADHGAALFNLEVDGYRYSRISNPTTAVLERRLAALEGGLEALAVSSGQAALNYAVLTLAEHGSNIVSVPQLYGTTYTLFGHILPGQGIGVRFAASDKPEAIEKLIDDKTRAVFCESVGNPAGNICDIEALADVAHRHALPRQHVREQRVRCAVELRRRDDVVAHAGEVQHRVVHRGLTCSHAHRLQSTFERCHAALQHGSRGIGDTRVAVALGFQVEERRGVFGAVERVGHGLVDGYRNRAHSGVGLVTRVNGDCFAFHRDSNDFVYRCAAVVRSAGAIVLIATAAAA